MLTTKFHNQWFAVEIPAIPTRSLVGATSVQYKKLAPRKPIGMKKLNKNTNKADATCAEWLVLGNDEEMASASMQDAIPQPLNMKSLRRPNRSMVKKATKQERNFQVRAPPERTREISASRPRPCWKMIWIGIRIMNDMLVTWSGTYGGVG
jgi:hypothetical protein